MNYERTVWECPRCRHSHAPLDGELGVLPHDQMTLGVAKKVAFEVSRVSFPEASRGLRHQLELEVSVSECHRVAREWGERLDALQRQREAAWRAPHSRTSRPAAPERQTQRLVVEADATATLTRAGEEHKMVWCATGFGLEGRSEKEQGGGRATLLERRFGASGLDFEDFEERFRALLPRLGAHASQAVAFISDGAPCLWRMAEEYLPRGATLIQDFWHVCEHLASASLALHREGPVVEETAGRWRSLLREGRVEEILEELRESQKRLRGKRKRCLQGEIHYLETGKGRMDYARYEAEGWPIGSGAVEGTCKHLVKERYNVTGARWSRENIPWVLALRLSIFNEEWEGDWHQMRKAA